MCISINSFTDSLWQKFDAQFPKFYCWIQISFILHFQQTNVTYYLPKNNGIPQHDIVFWGSTTHTSWWVFLKSNENDANRNRSQYKILLCYDTKGHSLLIPYLCLSGPKNSCVVITNQTTSVDIKRKKPTTFNKQVGIIISTFSNNSSTFI